MTAETIRRQTIKATDIREGDLIELPDGREVVAWTSIPLRRHPITMQLRVIGAEVVNGEQKMNIPQWDVPDTVTVWR